MNGSDVTTIVEGLTAPDSIAIDFVHNYMYFTDWVEDKISRVKVHTLDKPQKLVTYTFGVWLTPPNPISQPDGTDLRVLLRGKHGMRAPEGITLDVINNKMYCTHNTWTLATQRRHSLPPP